jgi:hypothetical protein
MLMAPAGPAAVRQRPCHPVDVTATATTRAIVGGVAGVVHLQGKSCSLHVTLGTTGLLDAAGHHLKLTVVTKQSKVNPPDNVRPDLELAQGRALWGFTWTGSWCGAKAATVVLPMTDDPSDPNNKGPYRTLQARLIGPQPLCTGRSSAVLRSGVPGSTAGVHWPADAVLPAPPSWAALGASISLPATSDPSVLAPFTLTLTNPTAQPIALSPCPEYTFLLAAGSTEQAGPGVLPCHAHETVPAHGSAQFTIPAQDYAWLPATRVPAGTRITVRVAIAAAPTATATTRAG